MFTVQRSTERQIQIHDQFNDKIPKRELIEVDLYTHNDVENH